MKWENVTSQGNHKKNADFEGRDVTFFLLSFFSTSFSAIADQMILLPIRSMLTSWLPLTQIPFDKKPKKAIDLLEITQFTCQVRPRPRKITIFFFNYLISQQAPSPLSCFREAATDFFLFIIYSSIHRFCTFYFKPVRDPLELL